MFLGDDSDYEYHSIRTRPGCGVANLKQKAPAVRCNNSHNQPLLSEVTLSRLNQKFGDAAWTDDCIHQWSSKSFPKKRKTTPSWQTLIRALLNLELLNYTCKIKKTMTIWATPYIVMTIPFRFRSTLSSPTDIATTRCLYLQKIVGTQKSN